MYGPPNRQEIRVRFLSHALIIATVICLVPSALDAQALCGVQRWPVKIWIDQDAAKVDTVPIPITVAELVRIPRPQPPFPNSNRVPGVEFQTFVLRARFMEARPQDADSDIHVVVRDLADERATLVTEIPHPDCAQGYERLARLYEDARAALRRVPRDGIVEIVGIGFFDTDHGQRGMWPNGLEIHPVLYLRPILPLGVAALPQLDSTPPRSLTVDSTQLADSVWINSSSGVYHCRGTTWFGRTARGRFASEREALQSGARPAGGQRCRAGTPD